MKKLEFKIENTGGVTHAELTLEPGVNVLLGPNGAGKTSCIDAVVRASGGKAPLERKDGTDEGRVEGPGVTLTVKQVVRTDGRAELELADVGPLGRLIDPRLKNRDAAARERIRALVELIGVGVEQERILELCGNDQALFLELSHNISEGSIDNLLEASETLRRLIHARARNQEEKAAIAGAEAEASLKECRELLERLGGADGLSKLSAVEATAELEEAIRNHDRALSKCEAREELEGRQDMIRGTLGPRPKYEAAKEKYQTALDCTAERAAELEAVNKKLAALELTAESARKDWRTAESTAEDLGNSLEEKKEDLESWERVQAVLNEKPSGPTRDEVEKIRLEGVERTREGLRLASLTETFTGHERSHDAAVLEHERASKKAEELRELAADIPQKLGKLLTAAGAPGFTVNNGRLHVTSAEGPPRDFEGRCSTGERVKAALEVAAKVYGGRVLALDGEVWGNLDPENQKIFAGAARDHDLCVITEEPAGGPLRVELQPKDQ